MELQKYQKQRYLTQDVVRKLCQETSITAMTEEARNYLISQLREDGLLSKHLQSHPYVEAELRSAGKLEAKEGKQLQANALGQFIAKSTNYAYYNAYLTLAKVKKIRRDTELKGLVTSTVDHLSKLSEDSEAGRLAESLSTMLREWKAAEREEERAKENEMRVQHARMRATSENEKGISEIPTRAATPELVSAVAPSERSEAVTPPLTLREPSQSSLSEDNASPSCAYYSPSMSGSRHVSPLSSRSWYSDAYAHYPKQTAPSYRYQSWLSSPVYRSTSTHLPSASDTSTNTKKTKTKLPFRHSLFSSLEEAPLQYTASAFSLFSLLYAARQYCVAGTLNPTATAAALVGQLIALVPEKEGK